MRTQRFTVSLMVPSRERKVRKHTHTHKNTPSISRIRRAHRLTSRHPRRTPRAPRAIDARASLNLHSRLHRVTASATPKTTDARATNAIRDKQMKNVSSKRARRVSIDDVPCSLRGAARKGGSRRLGRAYTLHAKTLTFYISGVILACPTDRIRAFKRPSSRARVATSRAVGVTASYARATRGVESFVCRRLAMPRGRS